jgi:hypothetical protein
MDRARRRGLDRDGDAGELTDELLAAVIAEARASRPNGKSEAWEEAVACPARPDQGVAGCGPAGDQRARAVGPPRCGGAI